MKDLLEKLQAEVVDLTRLMKEKSDKGHTTEVQELSEKLDKLLKDQAERKHQFDVGTKIEVDKKAVETKLDELFIASFLCTRKDGSFDKAAYLDIYNRPEYQDAVKATGFTTDPNATNASTYGQEFIPQAFSSTLYEEVWLKLQIAALFGRIPMPASTYTLPFAPGRLIARASAENTAITKDRAKTSKIVFSAQKIMSNVSFTDEFDQDSVVAVLPFIRTQLIDGFALAQETMCLNGDGNGTGATNIYNAAITGEDCRKLVYGIRSDAMNGSKGNCKIDFAAATVPGFVTENLRGLRTAMGKYGKNPGDLAYIVSMGDYNKMLAFTGYQALYQYAGAVTTTGELGRVDNIPIIVTELIPKIGQAADAADALGGLNTTGKFDGTTYTKTCCVLVNKTGYLWGDRKQFSLETFRNPYYQTLDLIGSQRLDFEKVLAPTDPTCAVGYNYI